MTQETALRPYEPIWEGIVQRKIEGAGHQATAEAYKTSLLAFGRMRDIVDIELQLLKGSVSQDDLRNVIDGFISWLDDIARAADRLFAQTSTEPAMEVYRRRLRILRQILVGIRDGDQTAWSVLSKRAPNDRSDPGAVKRLKDQ